MLQIRKFFVFVIGISVLLIGIAFIVLPGPAFIVIPLGLTILASEFFWARRWLQEFEKHGDSLIEFLKKKFKFFKK